MIARKVNFNPEEERKPAIAFSQQQPDNPLQVSLKMLLKLLYIASIKMRLSRMKKLKKK